MPWGGRGRSRLSHRLISSSPPSLHLQYRQFSRVSRDFIPLRVCAVCDCSGELMHDLKAALFGPFVSGGEDRPDPTAALLTRDFLQIRSSCTLQRRSQYLTDVLQAIRPFVSSENCYHKRVLAHSITNNTCCNVRGIFRQFGFALVNVCHHLEHAFSKLLVSFGLSAELSECIPSRWRSSAEKRSALNQTDQGMHSRGNQSNKKTLPERNE